MNEKMTAKDAVFVLAAYAAGSSFARLPAEVISALKRITLDGLGTALAAGTLASECRALVDTARDLGGAAESTILGSTSRVPAPMAAFANGALVHALNYDDAHPAGHLGAITLPAALAVAERRGGVSGREFLAALAAGTETMARLGMSTRLAEESIPRAKPQPTQILGFFAAAASAGRAMQLGESEMVSAFGLALMQASGSRQPMVEGRPAKAIYTAFPNYGGVLSAILSQRGLQADCSVFEGEAGLFETHYGGKYDRSVLLATLGNEFHTPKVEFKPWPTTRYAHPFIEAALQLIQAHDIHLETIRGVHLRGGSSVRNFCEPLSSRQSPQTGVEASDSIFFCVAKALANRNVTLADFQPDGLQQPEALQVARRMSYSIDPGLGRAGILEVMTISGKCYSMRVDAPIGHPSRPLTDSQISAKFLQCAQHAAPGLPRAALERVVNVVYELETLSDMRELTALIRG